VSLSVHVTTNDDTVSVALAGAADAGMLTPLHAPLTEALADARVLVSTSTRSPTSTARRCGRCSSASSTMPAAASSASRPATPTCARFWRGPGSTTSPPCTSQ
jgi:hypothetical protein